MNSIEKSHVSNLEEGKKFIPKTPSDSPPPIKNENTIVKHPELGYEYNILKEYKDIYDRLEPTYQLRLLGYTEEYRNEVLGKIKKEYEQTGKNKYILDKPVTDKPVTDKLQLPQKDIEQELFNIEEEIEVEENKKISPP